MKFSRSGSCCGWRAPLIALGVASGWGMSTPLTATPSEQERTHVIIVTGLSGTDEYAEGLKEGAETLIRVLDERPGDDPGTVEWLAEDVAVSQRVTGRSTLEEIEQRLEALAGVAELGDAVFILLLGHGSGRGEESRLNLPGPDLDGATLSTWLEPLRAHRVGVVNAASASGGFVGALSSPGWIVATATRSPREREHSHFGRFFVEAFADGQGDVDKDERVSLLEAFQYAKGEVARHYERDNQLLTEHPLLDDTGDGEGSLEPSATGADGSLASRFFLTPATGAAAAADDPELRRLLEEKETIEDQIASLRARRESFTETEYDAALEELLLDLAVLNRAIRERTPTPPDPPPCD